jgi:sugar phosphate isomerase/epimerase
MIPKVIEARHVKDYRVWMRFQDGTEGEIDLKDKLWGEVFEALKDVSVFRKLRVDPELDTIVWPNGADLAPEFLYQQLRPDFSFDSAGGKTGAR